MIATQNFEKIKAIDPSGMYDKIYNFPEQIEEAAKIGAALQPDTDYYNNIAHIIVVGMGGSAIGGDLVRSYIADKVPVPFYICRNYALPEFVNENSLVVISSYSGNTEETLAAFQDALKRKAKIACFTSGGKVADMASENNLMLATLPTGYPPRAALGFSFIPLLYFLSKIDFIGPVENDISRLVESLKKLRQQYSADIESDQNPARKLAEKMYGKIPIIYTGPELTDAIGTRWKGQICENAKCLAFNNQFPEFNHNELVGWKIIEAYKDKIMVIYLKNDEDHDRVTRRMDVVRQVIENLGVETIDVNAQGEFRLGRMFSLIQLGDFASLYLALLNNIDPTPVEVIDFLKGELAK
jgi:glucose/mannose-6-phosphate isomerase